MDLRYLSSPYFLKEDYLLYAIYSQVHSMTQCRATVRVDPVSIVRFHIAVTITRYEYIIPHHWEIQYGGVADESETVGHQGSP